MAGSLFNGRLVDAAGRRRTLMLNATVFLAATALSALAPSYGVLLVGRALVGLAVGSTSSTVPIYLSEIAPPQQRGRAVALNQVMITLGVVAAYLVDFAFARSGSGAWRAMLAVGLVPAAGLLVGMLHAPESPAWLEARRRAEQERAPDLRRLLRSSARAPLAIGIALAVIQQFSGINAVIYYAPSIMGRTGLSASDAILYSVIVGAVNAAATLPALRLVDRLGRRPLLLASLAGCLASLVLLGLTFTVGSAGSWLALVCLLGYIVAFAVGLGPLFWVLIAEIFPPRARASGAGVATAANWLSNFVVGLIFLPLVGGIGPGATFLAFAAVCAGGLVFVVRYVPETAGRTFEEIEADLRSRSAQTATGRRTPRMTAK